MPLTAVELEKWKKAPIGQIQLLGHHIFSMIAYGSALYFHRCERASSAPCAPLICLLLWGRFWFFAVMAGLSEMSTIFLNNVLLCKTIYWKAWMEANANWFLVFNGVMLWACFIVFRLILFPLTIGIFLYDVLLSGHPAVEGTTLYETIFYPSVLFGLFLLSLAWFSKIHKGFVKAAFGESKAAEKKQ